MQANFQETILGRTGMGVRRLGLSTSYFPGKKAVHYALDHGVNYFFGYGWDRQMMRVLRDLSAAQRQRIIVATGGYNWIWFHSNLRKDLEKRLRQLRTDCLDVFLFLGVMKPKQYSEAITAEMIRFREEGKVRAIGLSCHDRKFVGQLAEQGDLDVMMMRYNAAHRGAARTDNPGDGSTAGGSEEERSGRSHGQSGEEDPQEPAATAKEVRTTATDTRGAQQLF
jgi:aryl-alcohol dehydrogenase-like predicted oxidoreductase